MKESGTKPSQLEIGNAWDVRCPDIPKTNWIVGAFPTIPVESLRFMQQSDVTKEQSGAKASDIAVKWFLHKTTDPSEWGDNKPTSAGRTMSILVSEGEMELTFTESGHEYKVILNRPGDFSIWGPGLGHSWRPLQTSAVLTIRWTPE